MDLNTLGTHDKEDLIAVYAICTIHVTYFRDDVYLIYVYIFLISSVDVIKTSFRFWSAFVAFNKVSC